MLTLALLVGIWSSSCTQTQINGERGHSTQSYTIAVDGGFVFTRQWYQDSRCTKLAESQSHSGKLTIGARLASSMFNPNAHGVDYSYDGHIDMGAMELNGNILRVARGQADSGARNTMLEIISYKKR